MSAFHTCYHYLLFLTLLLLSVDFCLLCSLAFVYLPLHLAEDTASPFLKRFLIHIVIFSIFIVKFLWQKLKPCPSIIKYPFYMFVTFSGISHETIQTVSPFKISDHLHICGCLMSQFQLPFILCLNVLAKTYVLFLLPNSYFYVVPIFIPFISAFNNDTFVSLRLSCTNLSELSEISSTAFCVSDINAWHCFQLQRWIFLSQKSFTWTGGAYSKHFSADVLIPASFTSFASVILPDITESWNCRGWKEPLHIT